MNLFNVYIVGSWHINIGTHNKMCEQTNMYTEK